MTTTSDLDEPIDGRTARAVRTKDAIVAACIAAKSLPGAAAVS